MARTWQEAVREYVGAPDDMPFAEVYELGRRQHTEQFEKQKIEYDRRRLERNEAHRIWYEEQISKQ